MIPIYIKQKTFSLVEKMGDSLANWSDKGFAESDIGLRNIEKSCHSEALPKNLIPH